MAYEGRTPHIDLGLKRGERTLLTTLLDVKGDPGNARDFVWRSLREARDRAALTRPLGSADGAELRAQLPQIVVLS